jgi:predicted chitinase
MTSTATQKLVFPTSVDQWRRVLVAIDFKPGNSIKYAPVLHQVIQEKTFLGGAEELAAFLGQGFIETSGMANPVESLHYKTVGQLKGALKIFRSLTDEQVSAYLNNSEKVARFAYQTRNGNINGSDDCINFIGRGFIQITGRNNYQLVENKLHADLLKQPQKLGTDPILGMRASCIWWQLNISPVFSSIANDLDEVSYLVNLGRRQKKDKEGKKNNKDAKPNHFRERYSKMAAAKQALINLATTTKTAQAASAASNNPSQSNQARAPTKPPGARLGLRPTSANTADYTPPIFARGEVVSAHA